MAKTKKTLAWLVAALLLLTAVLAGCGGNNAGGNNGSSQGSQGGNSAQSGSGTEEEIVLNVWGAINEESGPGELIQAFMDKHPGIKVQYNFFKNDDTGNTKVNTALLSGEDIDVFINYGPRRVLPRVEGDLLEDLTPYIERDQFYPDEQFGEEHLTIDGKVYALPSSSIKYFVWLNKDALDEAGLPVPDDNWTWDDFKEYAIALTKGEGANKRYGAVYIDPGFAFALPARGLLGTNYLYKDDGTSNLDHPAFEQSLRYRIELENDLKVAINRIEMLSSKMMYYTEFFNGNAAMMIATDPAMRFAIDFDNYPRDWTLAFANLPRYDEEMETNYNGRSFFDYIAMNKRSNHKDAAWELIKFWSTEGSQYLFKYGRASAWKQTDKEAVADLILSDDAKKLTHMDSFNSVFMDFDSPGYNDTNFTAYSQIDAILTQEFEKAQTGQLSVEEAIANMKRLADEEIRNATE